MRTICLCLECQEAVETIDPDITLDLELHGKLHILYGGTKVVQHSPPSKTGAGLRGKFCLLIPCTTKLKNVLFSIPLESLGMPMKFHSFTSLTFTYSNKDRVQYMKYEIC